MTGLNTPVVPYRSMTKQEAQLILTQLKTSWLRDTTHQCYGCGATQHTEEMRHYRECTYLQSVEILENFINREPDVSAPPILG